MAPKILSQASRKSKFVSVISALCLALSLAASVAEETQATDAAAQPEETQALPTPESPSEVPSTTPENAAILQELDTILQGRQSRFKEYSRQIISELESAAASPSKALALYKDAVREVDYKGKSADYMVLYQNWLKDNALVLESAEFKEAAMIHCQYLLIAVKKSLGEPIDTLLPDLLKYVTAREAAALEDMIKTDVVAAKEGKNKVEELAKKRQELFSKSIAESPFAVHLKVAGRIASLSGSDPASVKISTKIPSPASSSASAVSASTPWELVPNNTSGIYDKIIMPHLRASKSPQIEAVWRQRLAAEDQLSKSNKNKKAQANYETNKRPSLLWNQAKDAYSLEKKTETLKSMLDILKNYENHSSFDKWATELKALAGNMGATTAAP